MNIAVLILSCGVHFATAGQITITLKHTWDCSSVYACVFGKPVDMPDCASGWTFSLSAKKCVEKGSNQTDCTPQTKPTSPNCTSEEVAERCRLGGILAHPGECHTFYNCSKPLVPSWPPGYSEPYWQECPYPQLFDERTSRCQNFEDVRCGNRKEYKNGCDYKSNKCYLGHCIPCSARFPSCEGKPDGMNVHKDSLWSPYYILCHKERYITKASCSRDAEGWTQFFHPELNKCVPIYMIPQERGGAMPDCTNRTDGFYPDDFGRCDRYSVCLGKNFLSRGKCSVGKVFDPSKMGCEPVEAACGPCGRGGGC